MPKKPTAIQVAQSAIRHVQRTPPISYDEMDCYRFIRQCVRDSGGDMRYAGTNDVFRAGLTERLPLDTAIAQQKLAPGWALFIVRKEGDGTPEKYRNDGFGDAYHMGLYTEGAQAGEIPVAHSSQSRGIVCASTLQNGWNWAGRLKDVAYAEDGTESGDTPATDPPPVRGTVTTESGDLIMRKLPGGQAVRGQQYLLKIPRGAHIDILRQEEVNGERWGQTRYANKNGDHTGWVSMDFVRLETETGEPPSTDTLPAGYMLIISALDNRPLTAEQVSGLISEISGSGYQAEIIPIAIGEDG